MHLVPQGREKVVDLVVSTRARSRELDRLRAVVLRGASRLGNYRTFSSGPRVTVPRLKAGGVRICLSVLYSPFDEMDLALKYGSPPLPRYFPTLIRQLEDVEAEIAAKHSRDAAVVHNPKELTAARRARKIALIHCVEGGFHLGATPEAVDRNVKELAKRGVAYITLAHLFYRGVAANAPAIPFVPDNMYRRLFPQPPQGLTDVGRAAIKAMVRERLLVDVAHMSDQAILETLAYLDEVDPKRKAPLVASHAGYRFGEQEYNLDDATIEAIAARKGVIGVILSEHQAADGLRRFRTRRLGDSLEILYKHIDRIREITGSHRHTAIGSDHDGFIKPTLSGLEDSASLAALGPALDERYGERDAEKIRSANVVRLLRGYWRSR